MATKVGRIAKNLIAKLKREGASKQEIEFMEHHADLVQEVDPKKWQETMDTMREAAEKIKPGRPGGESQG